MSIFVLPGCSTFHYYSQAIGGQLHLVQGRQPIAGLLGDPKTPTVLRERLKRISAIREFAQDSLALPVGDTYSGYIELDRDYVVWNVLAAPQDGLELKHWCYPVVGCQSYRGYFSQKQAQTLAQELQEDGWDTWAPGVIAYSSLGWFDDPVLSTFAHWPEARLAALVFHELSHKAVYINGDTTFNESYATAVEMEGLQRYLDQPGQAGGYAKVREYQRMVQEFTAMVMATAADLRMLYSQTDLPTQTVRARKAVLLDQLRAEYHTRSRDWPNPEAYAHFVDEGLNNARIASVGTYNRWVPAFRQLLLDQNGDFKQFHEAVRRLSELPTEERERQLSGLADRFAGDTDQPEESGAEDHEEFIAAESAEGRGSKEQ